MGIQSIRPGIAAPLYGAVLFLAGFVAVLGFWNLGDHPDHLTGLFSYRSATWGDGLFLPLQAIAVKYLVDGLSRPRHRWLVEAATATGFLLGVFVIWSWWHDPSPQLNWTMPEPHTFTAAGYWHALFLIGACGVFARLWTDLLLRLHHHRFTPDVALRTLNSGCFATALGSAVCYVALAGFDSSRSASTQAGLATIIALFLGLVAFLTTISLVTGRVLILSIPSVVGATLVSVGVVFIIIFPPRDFVSVLSAIAAMATGFALASTEKPVAHDLPASRRMHAFPSMELLSVPALFLIVPLVGAQTADRMTAPLAIVIVCSALLVAVIVRALRDRTMINDKYMISLGISGALLFGGLAAAWIGQRSHNFVTGGFIMTLVGSILGQVFLPFYKRDFDLVMQIESSAERKKNRGRPTPEELAVTRRVWSRIAGFAVAAFSSLLALTIAVAPSLGWKNGKSLEMSWIFSLPILTSLAMLLLARPAVRRSKNAPGSDPCYSARSSSVFLLVPALGGLISTSALFLISEPANIFSTFPFFQSLFPVFQSLFLAGFAVECTLGNGRRIHLIPLDRPTRISALFTGLAVFGAVYWSLTSGITQAGGPTTVELSFLTWAIAVSVVTSMIIVSTNTFFATAGKPHQSHYGPFGDTKQDLFLLSILWLVVGWLPQLVITHIPPDVEERWSAIGSILAGFLLLFGAAFLWVLDNNDTHNGRERERWGQTVPPYARYGAPYNIRLAALPRRLLNYYRHGSVKDLGRSRSERLATGLDGHLAVQNVRVR
jgi:hypothetical protein